MNVGLLLAAGLSRRFGSEDKLLAPLPGGSVVKKAADALRSLHLDHLIVVAASQHVAAACEGFRVVINQEPEKGLGRSLALGVVEAQALGASRLLVTLADMPFVTREHLALVMERCTDDLASASTQHGIVQPPACFPQADLHRLILAKGDEGARKFLKALPGTALIAAQPPAILADIDTREECEAAAS